MTPLHVEEMSAQRMKNVLFLYIFVFRLCYCVFDPSPLQWLDVAYLAENAVKHQPTSCISSASC